MFYKIRMTFRSNARKTSTKKSLSGQVELNGGSATVLVEHHSATVEYTIAAVLSLSYQNDKNDEDNTAMMIA